VVNGEIPRHGVICRRGVENFVTWALVVVIIDLVALGRIKNSAWQF